MERANDLTQWIIIAAIGMVVTIPMTGAPSLAGGVSGAPNFPSLTTLLSISSFTEKGLYVPIWTITEAQRRVIVDTSTRIGVIRHPATFQSRGYEHWWTWRGVEDSSRYPPWWTNTSGDSRVVRDPFWDHRVAHSSDF